MNIDKGNACLLNNLAIPLSVRIVATLNLAVLPDVTRSEAQEDWRSALLSYILDKLAEIPSEGVNDLVALCLLHLVHMTAVGCSGNIGSRLASVDWAHIVVSKLNQDIVARLNTVVNLVPSAFVEIGAATTASLCTVHRSTLFSVEHERSLTAPAPHAIVFLVLVLHG